MDPYVSCPYDKVHRVPRSRIQRHLVKCEQMYPPLSICPYNATHRYPKDKFREHVINCPKRMSISLEDRAKTAASRTPPRVPCSYINDPDYECWDN